MKLKHLTNRIILMIYISLTLLVIFEIFTSMSIIEDKKISCESSFIIYKGDVNIDLFIQYNIFSDDGFINLSGSMYKSGKFIRDLNTKINFKYTKKDTRYSLYSTNIESSLLTDLELAQIEDFLPEFYLKNNINWSIQILRQNENNFLFMSSSTPSFLCISR